MLQKTNKKTLSYFLKKIAPTLLFFSSTTLLSTSIIEREPALWYKDLSKNVQIRRWLNSHNLGLVPPLSYLFDFSTLFGEIKNQRLENFLSLNLFRYRGLGRQDLRLDLESETGKSLDFGNTLLKPSYQVLQFDAVDKVFITTFDNQMVVFDSDDYQISKSSRSNKEPIITLSSKNPHSINSQDFKKALLGAKKISLGFRDDVFWVNQKGEKTKYKLIARDFLFSFLRTFFLTTEFRYKYGGSEQLDNLWYQKTKASKFLATSEWPNEYLMQLFNIDSRALLDLDGKTRRKPLDKISYKGKVYDALSFYIKTPPKTIEDQSIFDFFFKFLVRSNLFLPAPSTFILEETKKRGENIGSDLIGQIGYYWYAEKPEETFFVGPYLPMKIRDDLDQRVIIYKRNPYFYDRNFFTDKDRINEIVDNFYKQEITNLYDLNYLNFLNGELIYLPIEELSTRNLNLILNSKDNKISSDMLKYSVLQNKLRIARWNSFTFPNQQLDSNNQPNPEFYLFNDVFAKFMYGASLEELAKGEAKIAKRFFGDEAISFRSIINAAINWDKVYNRISNGNSLYSLTLSPPNGRFQGSDRDSSKYQTPIDAKEFINDVFVVKDGKRVLTIKHSDNLDNLNNPKESESLMGGGIKVFVRLQDLMTDLLDKFYQENNFSDSQKMDIPLAFYDRLNLGDDSELIKMLVDLLNDLDRKARLNFNYISFNDTAERDNFFYSGSSPLTTKEWLNYFEGNGATLNAFLGFKPFYAVFLPIFASRSETDPDNPFPLLTRLSKLFIEGVERGRYRFAKPTFEWPYLNNKQLFQARNSFRDEELPDPDTEMARFLLDVEGEFTNEEHARLNVELAVLIGPKFNDTASVINSKIGFSYLKQRGYYLPITSLGIAYPMDLVFDPIKLG